MIPEDPTRAEKRQLGRPRCPAWIRRLGSHAGSRTSSTHSSDAPSSSLCGDAGSDWPGVGDDAERPHRARHRRDRCATAPRSARWASASTTATGTGRSPGRRDRTPPPVDQYAELKGRIHRACIAKLGTALYTIGSTEELATLVKDAVAEELAIDRTPLTRAERVRVAAGDRRRHPRLRPARAVPARPSVTEIMVNGAEEIYIERNGKHRATDVGLHRRRRTCCGSSTASSRRSAGASTRRSPMVDARLPTAAASTRSSRRCRCAAPTLTIRKFSRDPYTLDDLVRSARSRQQAATFLAACVRGKLNILDLGRHRLGQDDAPERAVRLRPRQRAHRDDRGRGRAPAPAAPRRLARGAPAEHRGRGRGHGSASWSATRCACAPTASSSARSAAPRRSTCSRR